MATLGRGEGGGGDVSVAASQGDGQAISWEQYESLPQDPRCEYIDGRLAVSPSPDLRHQQISLHLAVALGAALPASHDVVCAWEWKPAADAFIPDVIVFPVAEQTVPQRFTGTPALVVEVLSSNRSADLVVKMTKYAAVALPRYWLVDPREGTLTTYVLDDSGAFRPTRVLTAADGTADLDLGVATAVVDLRRLLRMA